MDPSIQAMVPLLTQMKQMLSNIGDRTNTEQLLLDLLSNIPHNAEDREATIVFFKQFNTLMEQYNQEKGIE